MSEREEGILSDPVAAREKRTAEARVFRIQRADIASLERNDAFRRWFGKFAEPRLMLDMAVTNGSEVMRFMGQRALLIEMIRDFDAVAPGFYERVLGARRALASELRSEPQLEE